MGGGDWSFSWGPQDDKESIDAILRALELGINWIDTAPVYGLGHSEEVVGQAIKKATQKPIIATKCGLVWDANKNISGRLKKESVREEAEQSLRRLQVDVIDLYQIHWPNPDSDIEEGWSAIAELIDQGKIRYGGVSNFSVEQMKRIQPIHRIASLQPSYSMLERGIEDEIIGFCSEKDIGIVAYSPMYKGLLTGKFSKERVDNLPKDDHRRRDPKFHEPQLSRNLQLVEDLNKIAAKNDKTLAQLAIAWTLRRTEITSAIVGARRPSQIEETVHAADWELSQDDINAIEAQLENR
jgi:aryl-alcohol dehydrogenase-like predicted oxidoreductase